MCNQFKDEIKSSYRKMCQIIWTFMTVFDIIYEIYNVRTLYNYATKRDNLSVKAIFCRDRIIGLY